ncbi:hypothetical protein J1605_005875 [Eschrichtius robustus]|uniref:Uncharacterized protein n=1 Tax=Eschrichtius robustus TaxID=9764 RepID=A0AB34H6S6_ESCRO|nr:hypothetical protein J1605_005875 [Eschrichtius robustus]
MKFGEQGRSATDSPRLGHLDTGHRGGEGRPLEWSRVAGFVGPAGVRLRGPRVPSTSASPPPVPRGASGSGGTMFTSTGSSGLCEYRTPPSWLSPTHHTGYPLEEAGGSGDSRGCRRFGGRSAVPVPEPW